MSAADAQLPAVSERLPAGLVREKARSIFSQSRWRLVALLEGSGEAGHCEVDGRRVAIEPTTSELELRRKLAERERSGESGPVLYLVDWLGSALLPRDLSARVAEGRVYRLRREERLRPIFRAKALLAAGVDAVVGEDEEPESALPAEDVTIATANDSLYFAWTNAGGPAATYILWQAQDSDAPFPENWSIVELDLAAGVDNRVRYALALAGLPVQTIYKVTTICP